MSIDKEIKSKFRNEWHRVAVNLLYTTNWMSERHKKHFERAGLTPQQYNILRILRGSGKPLSTLQIRERMLDRMSDTSRIVDRLLIKGLVQKTVNATDKRLVDVVITEKGLDLLAHLDDYNDEMDETFQNLSVEEAVELNRLLDKVRSVDDAD